MDNNNYFEKRKIQSITKLERLKNEMPYYVEEYFVGIESRTTPLTRLNYAYDLRVFYDFLKKKCFRHKDIVDITLKDLEQLDASDIELFLSYLSHYTINGKEESCSEHGKARKLATIRSFFKYFFNKGKIVANTAAKVAMPKLHDKEIIRLEVNDKVDEVDDMLTIVETGNGLSKKAQQFHSLTRLRDSAIITLFLGTGIRISELVGINIDDVDFNTNSFVVTRKGGNRAILYFNEEVAATLLAYLAERKENTFVPADEKALFLSLQNKRISTRTVQELVKKYAKIVSPLKKITPHKLRSTFGTNLYRQTGDIYLVADCLGHTDVNTTKKHYAAISEESRKKAARVIKLKKDDE